MAIHALTEFEGFERIQTNADMVAQAVRRL